MGMVATLFFFAAFQSNFYEQGLKALDEKRYQAAVENFINAIAAEPQDFAGVRVGAQGMFQTCPKASSGASSSVTTARAMSGT